MHLRRLAVPNHRFLPPFSFAVCAGRYDAWNVSQVETYIEQLMLYGANFIEMVAPDGKPSPLFSIPPAQMLVAMSDAAIARGIKVSLWYPYFVADPHFGHAWANLSRLDYLFVYVVLVRRFDRVAPCRVQFHALLADPPLIPGTQHRSKCSTSLTPLHHCFLTVRYQIKRACFPTLSCDTA